MFRHDSSHLGFGAANSSANSAELLWTYTTYRMVQSSPAVANGLVVVGCRDGNVYCFNASDGDPLWTYRVREEVWSSPAICEERVYVGADDGGVYCFDLFSGEVLWRASAGGKVRSSPAIADGRVYVGSGGGGVFCFDALDGAQIWNYPLSCKVDSSPAVCKEVVYFAADDFHVYALDASTGDRLWRSHLGSTTSSPSVHDGYVYVGSIEGYVYALNATTSTVLWKYQTNECVQSSPAVAYGCVYVGCNDNNLYCLNATDGKKIWQSPTGYWIQSSPAVADGNVYVGSYDYNIYCFNASTGTEKWSYPTGNFVESSPAVAEGVVYIGSDDSLVYALALSNSPIDPASPIAANAMPWTTVVFDLIFCSVAAVSSFAVGYYLVCSNKQAKQVADQKKGNWLNQKISWFSAHPNALYLLAILAFSTVFFINLGNEPLWFDDEQTYSQWAFHMIKEGDYLTPWAFGDVSFWISKPPLAMWLMSFNYQVLGVNNFALRLWSPIFSTLSLIIIFYLGRNLYNAKVGFLSAIVLGTFAMFFSFARHAMTDAPLIFFMLASLYFLLLSEKQKNRGFYTVLSGVFFGLALMTKQFEALLLPMIVFAYFVATKKNLRFLVTKPFTRFLAVGFLVFAPWVLYMVFTFGPEFWETHFLYSVVARTMNPLEGHNGGYLFYVNYLISHENPLWIALLPFALGLCAYKAVFKKSKENTLILLWAITVLAVFTFVQTKLYWYILPALPAFALAIANLIYQLAQKLKFKYQQPLKSKNG
ncbi:MAG: PQQ-binding-like beta-propeller repeat protein [Candidatus Bathyarchaeota archaeon]|nr:PQQ-binding-like beta-propeller repeat protein [Candidatus Bathyarchaeota archaeon]